VARDSGIAGPRPVSAYAYRAGVTWSISVPWCKAVYRRRATKNRRC